MRTKALFSLFVLLLASSETNAWLCLGWPDSAEITEEWLAQYEFIAVVEVQETVVRRWLKNGEASAEVSVRLHIVEAFKGTASGAEVTMRLDFGLAPPSHFDAGDTYLVFANRADRGDGYVTNDCQARKFKTHKHGHPSYHAQLQESVQPVLEVLRTLVN
ncbi:MAG: hypothetical protein AAF468_22585 [Pseudomonadota bacterium]